MIVFKTKQQMLEEIGFEKIIREDRFTLKDNPDMYFEGEWVLPKEMAAEFKLKTLPPEEKPPHIRMQENWEETWTVVLITQMKKEYFQTLADETGLEDYQTWHNYHMKNMDLPAVCPVNEMCLNAMMYGNKFDMTLPISFTVYKGTKGGMLRVEDSGDGFDYREVIRKLENGIKHAAKTGMGFKRFSYDKPYNVMFEGKGNTGYIQVIKKERNNRV